MENCPNCNRTLKDGILSNSKIISSEKTALINEYSEKKSDSYCRKCGKKLYESARSKLIEEKEKLIRKLEPQISIIPIISTHSPLNWDYDIFELVTAQTTTGTGFISDFTSSFADIFGTQSGTYNKKIKAGENKCKTQLRKQALDLGANAIIATDIDYAEVGGLKGMLMVCMTGTAVKLKNIEVLGNGRSENIEKVLSLNERLLHLAKFKIDEFY
ncbi:heavy metal-binding domain-containing protein [Candidatus Woesearchaeota archaeon]|jgi:uncharacterized protein YbjQ (UPF0145 family)|nr:heavy metal-binding domain-containing protein [Bacteroidota bacterium]MBT4207940.1 heavy metal-binding domain-containing protein [Candidatus Woesearchaeota archaeon]MBT5528285.1 heavy metal-binding domain-containing protein [Cytophagia bacterium]MBT7038484.1 heavy metal-binding domain-containing protein [Bacteroidota bacterium]